MRCWVLEVGLFEVGRVSHMEQVSGLTVGSRVVQFGRIRFGHRLWAEFLPARAVWAARRRWRCRACLVPRRPFVRLCAHWACGLVSLLALARAHPFGSVSGGLATVSLWQAF